jgi:ABC-type nitrate/sulfonate/bicarbonate transport system ATPase subunit
VDHDLPSPTDAAPRASLVVAIRNKVYRGVSTPLTAVQDLVLRLEAGRFGAILGESGCGKSTVLRIAAGLDADFEGQVQRPGEGRLGIAFQEPRLLPWRTVEENVRLALPDALSGQDLTPLFAALGLHDHRDRHPGELSLGLARRASLARAFAVQPDLLLLDEPFVSLDPGTTARMRIELTALLAARPCTTLMVTHDEDEALALADRVFVFSARPARILGELGLEAPREARDDAWMAQRRDDLARLRSAA